jgi:FKBP-type peptidyl-prolyl cis-trans isomerase FklB
MMGVETARNIQREGLAVDLDILIKGVRDALSGGKLLLTEPELWALRNATHNEVLRRAAAKRQNLANVQEALEEQNKRAGDAFLVENQAKEGVVTLPSGLQYRILNAGDGRRPTDSDLVEVSYRGSLLDGTVFDSSHARGKPSTFSVAGVIPGWREAFKLMPVGSKWELFVPPELAYGERGLGRHIGPNATLVYEMELLAIR